MGGAAEGAFRAADPRHHHRHHRTAGVVALLPARLEAPNGAEYAGEDIARQQREAYPDVQPMRLDAPPPHAFERALAAARSMGWDIADANAADGRIEATDTTFWYGFKDDVVVRVRADGAGSRIDVRSMSRLGGSDVARTPNASAATSRASSATRRAPCAGPVGPAQ
ncbi:DUF1499 domain-containing protein [Alkalisalibacterium limincola]|uniref:DUF1499 domain-containing protein n=1 Tax=Alkalisalibacterium limincola TaxID=2699169 RepID=UPI001C9CF7F6|nr:DUF1499 domain-containing protein [Alkalisalibacterium limincola]